MKRYLRSFTLPLVAVCGLLFGIIARAANPVVTVGPSGCNYTNIQDALNNTGNNVTINVRAGHYSVFEVEDRTNIQIIGESRESVLINCVGKEYGSNAYIVRDSTFSNLTFYGGIQNFWIEACTNVSVCNVMSYAATGSNTLVGVMLVASSRCRLENIKSYCNPVGVYVSNTSSSEVHNVETYSNDDGIVLRKTTHTTLSNVKSYLNDNFGLLVYKSAYNVISNGEYFFNSENGIAIDSSTNLVVSCNTVRDNLNSGISVINSVTNVFIKNIIRNHTQIGYELIGTTNGLGGHWPCDHNYFEGGEVSHMRVDDDEDYEFGINVEGNYNVFTNIWIHDNNIGINTLGFHNIYAGLIVSNNTQGIIFTDNSGKGWYTGTNTVRGCTIMDNDYGLLFLFRAAVDTNIYRDQYNTYLNRIADISHQMSDNEDLAPPSRIGDLDARYSSTSGDHRLALDWTAVGDSGPYGTATRYECRYSLTGEINESNWSEATYYYIADHWSPLPCGMAETNTVEVPAACHAAWFAVRAIDEVGNCGKVSNSPFVRICSDVNIGNLNCTNARTRLYVTDALNANYLYDPLLLSAVLTNSGLLPETVEIKAKYLPDRTTLSWQTQSNAWFTVDPGETKAIMMPVVVTNKTTPATGRLGLVNEAAAVPGNTPVISYVDNLKVYSLKEQSAIGWQYPTVEPNLKYKSGTRLRFRLVFTNAVALGPGTDKFWAYPYHLKINTPYNFTMQPNWVTNVQTATSRTCTFYVDLNSNFAPYGLTQRIDLTPGLPAGRYRVELSGGYYDEDRPTPPAYRDIIVTNGTTVILVE